MNLLTRIATLGLLFAAICFAQLPYPLPSTQDTTQFGKNLQRTMKLLATSTPYKRNTVKILVYGQSIAKQEWSDTVRKYLRIRYPYANIIMINRSIGGCWAGCLQYPVEYDSKPFYPDLILFDVYGWNGYGGNQGTQYESIIRYFREHTAAEVAMQNHHEGGTDTRNDNSDFIRLRNTYGVELIDVRTPWLQYMSEKSVTGAQLTSDGTHLNDWGNFLMARLWLPYLQYKPNLVTLDGTNLLKTYKVGTDIFWENGKLTLPFNGNRIDIVTDTPQSGTDSAKVFIDRVRPSEHKGTTMFLRPNDTQDTIFKHYSLYDWPWQNAAIMKFENTGSAKKPENWTLEFLTFSSATNFTYKVTGSQTGFDGNGAYSTQVFTSTSRIVSFNRDRFWLDNASYTPLPYGPGFKINWEARGFFTNTFIPPTTVASAVIDSVVILAQGLTNTNHLLELISTGAGNTPIKEIRVYQPFYSRVADNSIISTPNISVSSPVIYCSRGYASIKNSYVDLQNLQGTVTFWQDSLASIPVNPDKITLPGTYFIKKNPVAGSNIILPTVKSIHVKSINCIPIFSVAGVDTICSNTEFDLTSIQFQETISFSGSYFYLTDTTDLGTILDNPNAVTTPAEYYIGKSTDSSTYGYKKIAVIKDCNTLPGTNIKTPKIQGLKIHPNPSSDGKFLIEGNLSGENQFKLYDIIGNLILAKNVQHDAKFVEIDLKDKPSGMYILKTNKSGTHKLILK